MKKKCPQCKNIISTQAPTCLYCGRPNKFVTNSYVKKKWNNETYKNKNNLFENFKFKREIIISFLILVIIFIILYR